MNNNIRSILLKYPSFMAKDADKQIVKLFKYREDLENKIFKKRQDIFALERTLEEVNKAISDLQQVCEVEFEKPQLEEKQFDTCNMVIVNPDDARHS